MADVGLGKTRLLDELQARARLEGATTVTARSVETDRSQVRLSIALLSIGHRQGFSRNRSVWLLVNGRATMKTQRDND